MKRHGTLEEISIALLLGLGIFCNNPGCVIGPCPNPKLRGLYSFRFTDGNCASCTDISSEKKTHEPGQIAPHNSERIRRRWFVDATVSRRRLRGLKNDAARVGGFAVETGAGDAKNNLLKNAPHTADQIASDHWDRSHLTAAQGVSRRRKTGR